jgi:hypothetical protein
MTKSCGECKFILLLVVVPESITHDTSDIILGPFKHRKLKLLLVVARKQV